MPRSLLPSTPANPSRRGSIRSSIRSSKLQMCINEPRSKSLRSKKQPPDLAETYTMRLPILRLRHDGKTSLTSAVKSRVLLSLHLFLSRGKCFLTKRCKRHRVFWSPSTSAPPGGMTHGKQQLIMKLACEQSPYSAAHCQQECQDDVPSSRLHEAS